MVRRASNVLGIANCRPFWPQSVSHVGRQIDRPATIRGREHAHLALGWVISFWMLIDLMQCHGFEPAAGWGPGWVFVYVAFLIDRAPCAGESAATSNLGAQ